MDKLYPNTVNLYELEQTKMYGEDTKVNYGGDLDKELTYLDLISDLQHAWNDVFPNEKLWCDYRDTFKITKQVYEGDILGGEKFHDPDKKVMLGWECGFDGKQFYQYGSYSLENDLRLGFYNENVWLNQQTKDILVTLLSKEEMVLRLNILKRN